MSGTNNRAALRSLLAELIGPVLTRDKPDALEIGVDRLDALLRQAEREAEYKLASSITTDLGDAYYQGIPIWRYAEQLLVALQVGPQQGSIGASDSINDAQALNKQAISSAPKPTGDGL